MKGMHKRGALELSINAIVIVILAMTLLGLGLGFVRKMFKDITETTGTVQQQMRDQITEQLRTGDKPLAFPSSEVTIEKKGSSNLAIGVKNAEPGERKFKVRIYIVDDDTGKRSYMDSGTCKDECTVSAPEICEPCGIEGSYVYNKGEFELGVNENYIIPVKYIASSNPATYVYDIVAYKLTEGGDEWEEYATKSFFITIA